jgi:hypothetical protein
MSPHQLVNTRQHAKWCLQIHQPHALLPTCLSNATLSFSSMLRVSGSLDRLAVTEVDAPAAAPGRVLGTSSSTTCVCVCTDEGNMLSLWSQARGRSVPDAAPLLVWFTRH